MQLRRGASGQIRVSGTSAASPDRIYFIGGDIMNGLDQVVGATYLAKVLHPDVDLNPEVYREYLRLGLVSREGWSIGD